MSSNRLEEEMETSELVSLAQHHELVDSVEAEGSQYRVNIGAATFLLDPEGTREFLIKLLRSRHPNRE